MGALEKWLYREEHEGGDPQYRRCPTMGAHKLFTIGYEGRTQGEIIEELLRSGSNASSTFENFRSRAGAVSRRRVSRPRSRRSGSGTSMRGSSATRSLTVIATRAATSPGARASTALIFTTGRIQHWSSSRTHSLTSRRASSASSTTTRRVTARSSSRRSPLGCRRLPSLTSSREAARRLRAP